MWYNSIWYTLHEYIYIYILMWYILFGINKYNYIFNWEH